MLKANSPYSEVEWTAAEILRLVREEGYRFRDIAVCARSLEGCGSLVETIFARYGVPVFLSRMSDILQKPFWPSSPPPWSRVGGPTAMTTCSAI